MKTMTKINLTAVLCVAYAGGAVSLVQPLAAKAAEEGVRTQTVKFADLDLTRPAGVEALYRRIKAAARQVCELSIESERHLMGADQKCFKHAVDQAVADVNSEALTELHTGIPARLASR